jgi:radical SAM superfamily enzyme YgiQ (UPF0313 family)
MQIVLLHAPPWKIPSPGEPRDPTDGPPSNHPSPAISDADFRTIPYGLLSLAAQALRAGHQVAVFNLASFPWRDVTLLVEHVKARLFGICCLTSNRRGVDALARLVREAHPAAHIVVGGPHATALPRETLAHYTAIDTVVIGEGERTFMELVDRLEAGGSSTGGIAGTAWRSGDSIEVAPARPRIDDLDSLASPLDYFASHIIVTSRGCPGQCTFCDSKTLWGRRVHFHSVGYVLDMLQQAVLRHGLKFACIKDDTFTAHRKRALEICQGILERKLNFVWSCDTRVDNLDEELLRAMRMAGCRMLSLGVESASPEVLKNIKKNIDPDTVMRVTRIAKTFGFQVRYYMMWGNRGETRETFQESVDFIRAARPSQVIFTLLSVYPGTEEFKMLEDDGTFTPEVFFTSDVPTLKCFLGRGGDLDAIRQELRQFETRLDYWQYGPKECADVLGRLPNLHEAHLDLAGAYCRAGDHEAAEPHVRRALQMDYPLPGLAYNYLACIAAARGDLEGVQRNLARAERCYPHGVVLRNKQILEDHLAQGGPARGSPLQLVATSDFETVWLEQQPEKSVPVRLNVP